MRSVAEKSRTTESVTGRHASSNKHDRIIFIMQPNFNVGEYKHSQK